MAVRAGARPRGRAARARTRRRPGRAPAGLLDAALRDPDRLQALRATGLLDTDIAPSFDRLARLAAHVLNAPVALVSLVDADGHALGTLCVIDSRPRHWTTHQVQLLSDLAASVVTEIGLARAAGRTQPNSVD